MWWPRYRVGTVHAQVTAVPLSVHEATGCVPKVQPTTSACRASFSRRVAVSLGVLCEKTSLKPSAWSGGANWARIETAPSTVSEQVAPDADGQPVQPTKR